MNKTRLEAFSDGVIAIIITIMVLELKVPHGDQWADLIKLGPIFLSYVLSFLYIGIYWNNHHHMLHAVNSVNGGILWANLHLLFWLSLIPFTTGWMGENHFGSLPVALYAINLLLCGIAYFVLQGRIIIQQGANSALAQAVGMDIKGKVSVAGDVIAIPMALMGYPWLAGALLTGVALLWLVPDQRIEKKLNTV